MPTLLQKELDSRKIPVKVSAIVNDTVGTLMARAYSNCSRQDSLIGAIFGTGTNCAYLEQTENIPKLPKSVASKSKYMIINMEWAALDNALNVLPNTAVDKEVDRCSINPGLQMLEKRVSGMFLGEIFRLSCMSMGPEFCKGNLGGKFSVQWGVGSELLSRICSSNPEAQVNENGRKGITNYLVKAGIAEANISSEDIETALNLARVIGERSAKLAGIALASVCLQTKRLEKSETIDVGVDGSLVEYFPGYIDIIKRTLELILGQEKAKLITVGLSIGKFHKLFTIGS